MASLVEVKEKYNTLQSIVQDLKEKKIRLESEISTLQVEYNKRLSELLEKTGTTTFQDAVKAYEDKSQLLEQNILSLNEKLNKYLDTYGEDSDNA